MTLLIVVALSFLTAALVVFTIGPFRIALAVLFVLLFPGYTLVTALLPKRGNLDGLERLALSFGLSLAVVPLMGLVLNFTPWGIGLRPMMIALLVFVAVTAAIGLYRQRRLPQEERFGVRLSVPALRSWMAWPLRDKTISVLLVVALLGASAGLIYAMGGPTVGEGFTEFYLLDAEGKMVDYPFDLVPGKEGKVLIGIVNHERKRITYRLDVSINGERVGGTTTIVLKHEEKWEQEISFTPTEWGLDQKVGFMLYKGMDAEAYHTLHLWVDVKESP